MVFKILLTFVGLFACIHPSIQNRCTVGMSEDLDWENMPRTCQSIVEMQIQHELKASITYLAMSSYFMNEKHYRPGTAAFFLKSAKEERAHAKKFIEYLLMRGVEIKSGAIATITADSSWMTKTANVKNAFKAALNMERIVTKYIEQMIKICGGEQKEVQAENEYHTVDYLTSEFLKEQHEGEREIAGHLATLTRLNETYGTFAEMMFDKTIMVA